VTLRKATIQQRLREIREVLGYFSGLGRLGADELTANFERRLAVERGLTHLVDVAVKINSAVVTAACDLPPRDQHDSFIRMGEIGAIPAELATRLAPSAGLRNRLVHEYETIDYAQVAHALQSATRDYGEYVRAVAGYIQRAELE
jgi:uncharacterized protein YutE (UPF0331/DUF86 family)